MRRRLRWVVAAIVAATIGTGTVGFAEMKRADHLMLLALSHEVGQPAAWILEQGLYRLHPTPEEIREMNRWAGASVLLVTTDEVQLRRLLTHYMAAGLDLNQVHHASPSRITALHAAVLSRTVVQVRVLLELGARPDVQDGRGRLPLDLAREQLRSFPGDPALTEIVGLLEGTGRAARRSDAVPAQALHLC
jgi:hypothetical protein